MEMPPLGPEDIMRMASGFWVSKVLLTAAEFRLFDLLAESPADASKLASQLNVNTDALSRLLTALTALGFLIKSGDNFHNSAATEAYLLKDSFTFIGGNFGHFNHDLYPLWGHLGDAIRENSPRWQQAFGSEASQNPFETMYREEKKLKAFLEAMSTLAMTTAMELKANFDLTGYKCLLDVGGALGTLAIGLICDQPEMQAIVFDLPPVANLATEHIKENGMDDRITVIGGDVFKDPLPTGADLITLAWIIHDWDDEYSNKILNNCYQALAPGGTILVLEKTLNDDKSGPLWPALMSLNMLVASSNGRERTSGEYYQLLAKNGFIDMETKIFQGVRDLIIARKPTS